MRPDPGHKPMEIQGLRKHIQNLEAQMADLEARFPAHSMPPALLQQLDELDDALAHARLQLHDFEELGNDGI